MKPCTKIITAFVAAPLSMLIATATFAQEEPQRPSYKFVELDYVYANLDVESDDFSEQLNSDSFYIPTSFSLKGNYVVVEQLLFRGSYYYGSGEWKKSADVTNQSVLLGASWLAPTSDATGIDIGLDYRADKIDLKSKSTGEKGDTDIEGVGISFGVRAAPSKRTELGARVGWYEGDWNGAIGFNLNFAWNINERWGINTSWDRIDSDVKSSDISKYKLDQYALGGRFYF
jgi:hypothetical protein